MKVDAVTDEKKLRKIRKNLEAAGNKRNLLLFVMGVNNGLRIGDLLNVRVHQVRNAPAGGMVQITEQKTSKGNVLVINTSVKAVLDDYLTSVPLKDDDYLFKSPRVGKDRNGRVALTTRAAHHLIKGWCRQAGLKGNFGSHSLRKSWGFHQRTKYHVPFEVLCSRFGHSNPTVTMRYLGLKAEEVIEALNNTVV